MPTTKPSPTEAKAGLPALHLPDGRQAALLLLRLFELRDGARNKPMTRARLTPPMLKRLWNRRRLSPTFLQDVSDWLLVAGWVFFDAGPTYGVVRLPPSRIGPVFSQSQFVRTLARSQRERTSSASKSICCGAKGCQLTARQTAATMAI